MPTNDEQIRQAVRLHLFKDANFQGWAVEELGVMHGAARADFVVFDSKIHGIEIKSDLDSLERLPDQINYYNQVFDKVTLIVGKKHLYDAFNMIPDWWGVTIARRDSVSGIVTLVEIRSATRNPKQAMHALASLLWRTEALRIADQMSVADGIRSKKRDAVYLRLAESLDADLLRKKVLERLIARKHLQLSPR